MKYFEMLRKLFNSIFFFEKNDKQQKLVGTPKKPTKHIPPSPSFEYQQSLNPVVEQKLVSDNKENRTIISDSMLKEYWSTIDHNKAMYKDNQASINDDDEITILDQSDINNRTHSNNQFSDDDKADFYRLKSKNQGDDITYLYKKKIEDQDDDITYLGKLKEKDNDNDNDMTYLGKPKVEDSNDDITYLGKPKVKDQDDDDDITVFNSNQFSKNFPKGSKN